MRLQRSNIPTPTIDVGVDDPNVTIHIQVLMFQVKKVVVEQKTRSLVILVQILDPPPCQDYGFHAQFFTFILSNSLHFR